MQIIKRPENGKNYVNYEVSKNNITFDDELMINLSKKERDDEVTLDVCRDEFQGLICTVAGGRTYVAQVYIPARKYIEEFVDNPDYDPDDPMSSEKTLIRTAVPFDIDRCVLTLYEEE